MEEEEIKQQKHFTGSCFLICFIARDRTAFGNCGCARELVSLIFDPAFMCCYVIRAQLSDFFLFVFFFLRFICLVSVSA